MAAAEARAAWQRTANRCFVQEDAKRAPKLACPSTYPSSKQADAGPTNPHENTYVGFTPRDRNSSCSNLPPESRWWLQIQPNYVYQQKGLTNEQLMNTTNGKEDPYIMEESYELLEEMDYSVGSSVSKKVDDDLGFDVIGSEKSEPWWRVVDRYELASLVSQRSLDFVENCDLPRPQARSVKREQQTVLGKFDNFGFLKPSDDLKAQEYGDLDSVKVDTYSMFTRESACKKQSSSCEEQSLFCTDKQSSDEAIHKGFTKPNDPMKAQLLEALRHSQTRAREAEKAAKQAYAEKEHILKLFFKQASHLFAYKQWFQLLQLENLYFQIKDNYQPISTLLPEILPWAGPKKTRKLPKNRQKPYKGKKRAKCNRPKEDIGKFAVALALGLGLVGAGLFLGWTVAWMLPHF